MTQFVEDYSTSAYWHQDKFDFLAERFLPFVTEQEMLVNSPAFQKALADEATIEQAPAFQKLRATNLLQSEQRTLLRLLKRRFEVIPEPMIVQIKTTTDHALLEAWQDSLLDITDLAEFEQLMQRSQGDDVPDTKGIANL